MERSSKLNTYKYYTIMRQSKDPKYWRFQMSIHAQEYGIKPTARKFKTTIKTVKKWLSRYKEKGYDGLNDESRRPKCSPRRIPQERRDYLVKLKKKYKRIGSAQIKYLQKLPEGKRTLEKIWREAGISRKRRKKHQTKQNLREMKRKWGLFQQIDEDTKDLKDIPEYWIQMKAKGLPKIQYTARDVNSGLVYICFAYERSLKNSEYFADYVSEHLKLNGINLSKTIRQTDNGSEFIGAWNAKEDSIYTETIQKIRGQRHVTIPPGAHRFQSDVETFHNLIEVELYELENYSSVQNFLNKAYSYMLYFNLERINTYKENKTPIQLAKTKKSDITESIAMLPPIILDEKVEQHITQRGYDVRATPYR